MTDLLDTILEEYDLPGIAGTVVSSTAVIAQSASGRLRRDQEVPVTVHSRFHLGSNAKALTATLCARLVAEGSLTWTSRATDVLELGDTAHPAYRTITLDMLLRHQAGIPPYTHAAADDYLVPDLDEQQNGPYLTRFSRWLLANQPPAQALGTFSYSNAGYAVAAAMAEAASGRSYREALETLVLEPLGIHTPTAPGWPARNDPTQPFGHHTVDGASVPHPPDDEYQLDALLAPAGDLSLSTHDYGRFLQLNLRALTDTEHHFPGAEIRWLHHAPGGGPAAGWFVGSAEPFGRYSTHNGSAGTFVAGAFVFPDADRAIALLTNSGDRKAIGEGLKAINRRWVQHTTGAPERRP